MFSFGKKIKAWLQLIIKGRFDDVYEDPRKKGNELSKLIITLNDKLKSGKISVSDLIKGIIAIATQLSNFDLRLSFYGNKLKEMTEHLNRLASSVYSTFEETTASVSAITTSSSEMTNSIQQISSEANVLNNNTAKNSITITSIKKEGSEMMAYSETMHNDMIRLAESIATISESIEGVYDIADRTNLLALNASIEAARAGDAGRGFAVVASEIRKLSDSTKGILDTINVQLQKVSSASEKTVESVKKTTGSTKTVNDAVEVIADILTLNTASIQQITDKLNTIASFTEEMNASLEDVSSAMTVVGGDAENVNKMSSELEKIGKDIDETVGLMKDVEGKVETLSHNGGALAKNKYYSLSNDDFLQTVQAAVSAHVGWLKNLKLMVDNMEIKPIQTNDHKCGFGHFYFSIEISSEKVMPLWQEAGKLHHEFHKYGDIVLSLIKQNNRVESAHKYKETENLSVKIQKIFTEMMLVVNNMELNHEKVF